MVATGGCSEEGFYWVNTASVTFANGINVSSCGAGCASGVRSRKLLVRYEKLERSFLALNHFAAAIIAFRQVPLKVNIIYG